MSWRVYQPGGLAGGIRLKKEALCPGMIRVGYQIFKIGLHISLTFHSDHYPGSGQKMIPLWGQLHSVTKVSY